MAMKKAVVVGALGVIGRYIVERLLAEEDWEVIGLSRRERRRGRAIAISASICSRQERRRSWAS